MKLQKKWLRAFILGCTTSAHALAPAHAPAVPGSERAGDSEAPGEAPVGPANDKHPGLKGGTALRPGSSSEQIAATMLVFWSLNNGTLPAAAELERAGISESQGQKFLGALKSSQVVSRGERQALRDDFTDAKLGTRIAARKKIINFVDAFANAFPAQENFIPELLTVWGETRNVQGFRDEDDSMQQAKMASIVHVLRNRMQRARAHDKSGLSDGHLMWKLATRRYQFSAFEPYDPNLAELAFGPAKKSGTTFDLASLPPLDRRALINLAHVIVAMNRGDIKLPLPLGAANTRHYLSPELVPYDRATEDKLLAHMKTQTRFRLLRVPFSKPRFLVTVPAWAVQDSLITYPRVVLRTDSSANRGVVIPPDDFVYFRGIR